MKYKITIGDIVILTDEYNNIKANTLNAKQIACLYNYTDRIDLTCTVEYSILNNYINVVKVCKHAYVYHDDDKFWISLCDVTITDTVNPLYPVPSSATPIVDSITPIVDSMYAHEVLNTLDLFRSLCGMTLKSELSLNALRNLRKHASHGMNVIESLKSKYYYLPNS